MTFVLYKGLGANKVNQSSLTGGNGLACDSDNYFFGGASWSPLSLPDLKWWSDGVNSTIVHSSNLVSNWENMADNDFDLSQTSGALQPTTNTSTIGGLNSIYFDGTDMITMPDGAFYFTQSHSIFFMVQFTNSGSDECVIAQVGSGSRQILQKNAANTLFTLINGFTSGGVVPTGVPTIIGMTFDTDINQCKLYIDNVNTKTRTSAEVTQTIGSFRIGNSQYGTHPVTGGVGDAICCQSVLSDEDRTLLHDYLNSKYGIS